MSDSPTPGLPDARLRYGTLAVVVVSVALLFSPIKFGKDQLVWDRFSDACHFPMFLLLAFGAAFVIARTGRSNQRSAFLGFSLVVLFALLVELIQPYTGRSASWIDVRNGTLGAAFGAWAFLILRSKRENGFGLWGFTAAAFSIYLLSTVYSAWHIVRWQREEFPTLAKFESQDELLLWRPYGGEQVQSSVGIEVVGDGPMLKFTSGTGDWLGVEFKVNGLPWADYESLNFTISNPGADFDLSLRVDDDKNCKRFEDRFNTTVPVRPGLNTISIPIQAIAIGPKHRKLNMKRISRVLFFIGHADAPQTFYIDNVYLK